MFTRTLLALSIVATPIVAVAGSSTCRRLLQMTDVTSIAPSGAVKLSARVTLEFACASLAQKQGRTANYQHLTAIHELVAVGYHRKHVPEPQLAPSTSRRAMKSMRLKRVPRREAPI